MKEKKILITAGILIAAILTAVIIRASIPPVDPAVDDSVVRGNRIGNNGSYGMVAADADGEVYYANGGILHYAGEDSEEICSDSAMCLNLYDGWIYYANSTDQSRLYRIRTDGTGREKLSDLRTESIEIGDGNVYFASTVLGGEDSSECGIYLLSEDGEAEQIKQVNAEHLALWNGRLYYTDKDDGYRMKSIRPDGTNEKTIVDDFVFTYDMSGDRIYYSTREEIRSVNANGGGKKTVLSSPADSLVTIGDTICFSRFEVMGEADMDSTSGIFSVQTDGTSFRQICDITALAINVMDEKTLVCAAYTAVMTTMTVDIETGETERMPSGSYETPSSAE